MWSKGDRTEMRLNITELELYDEYNEIQGTIKVATKDADKILTQLNKLLEMNK